MASDYYGGRPTKYDEVKTCQSAIEYLEEFEIEPSERSTFALRNAATPSFVGLALHLGIANSTLDAWKADKDKPTFSGICNALQQLQHELLVGGGLLNRLNPQITKMMLGKHGYSDKQEIDHGSSDGSMTPKEAKIITNNMNQEEATNIYQDMINGKV